MDPERAAAEDILLTECNITPSGAQTTAELWQLIFINNAHFAPQFKNNIFNHGKPWEVISNDIRTANMNRLKEIYYSYPALKDHPQFLAELTKRKKRILRK